MLFPFSPPPGIFSDDTNFATGPAWVDGNNVRFVEGKAQVIGGWLSAQTLAASTNGVVRAIFPFTRSGAIVIAYGTTNSGSSGAKLLVGATTAGQSTAGGVIAAPADRTPVGIASGTIGWCLDSWGDTLLALPIGGTLYDQSGSSTAAAVTNAPDAINYMLVSAERQVLAFGCNEEVSGTFNGMCIRGSDIEDYTDWTTTASNNAFEHILEGHGTIVAGTQLGAYIVVWTQHALYLGQFLGDPAQTYRFDKVAENCGLIGPMAFTTLNERLYWMAPDGMVRTWVPGELPQMVPWPASRDFSANLDDDLTLRRQTVACGIGHYQEVWFHYKDTREGGPSNADINRYVAFCVGESARAQRPVWFRGLAGRSAMVDSGLLAGLTYGLLGVAAPPTVVAAVSAGSSSGLYLHEVGRDGTAASAFDPYITSGDFSLDNGGRRMMIRRCIPDFEDQAGDSSGNPDGNVALTLFVRQRPQDSSTTKGPHILTTSTTKKDFRASGNLVAVKLAASADGTSSSQGGYFRLGKLLFDVVPMGMM